MPRFGLGFRAQHFAALRDKPGGIDWLELLSDNFLGVGGPRRAQLEALRCAYPIALHGVGLGIANDTPPRAQYLAALRELADFVQPEFVSDHLCWTGIDGRHSHDLLPVASTREVLALVCERVSRVQDALGRRILLENASAYVAFRADELSEGDFFAELCARTGCGVLLDVNNLFVNAANLRRDPLRTLVALRSEDVAYLHLAGHTALADVRIDTHGAEVCADVWALFAEVVRRFPQAHVMLERDDAIPDLASLVRELDRARAIASEAERARPAPALLPAEPSPSLSPVTPREPWPALQRAFWQSAITAPSRDNGAGPSASEALLDAERPVAAARGLRVYADAYAANLRAALAHNFPTLARVLSPRDFSALADAYAAAHPPRSGDYVSYGAALPSFVGRFTFSDSYAIASEALCDLARLEQAQLEAQEARDEARGIEPAELAALAPEAWPSARFTFAAALRVVACEHDVLPAVRAIASEAKPPLPRRAPTAYLVARSGTAVVTETIDPRGASALARMLAGASFAEACAALDGDDGAHAAAVALACACRLGVLLDFAASRSRAAAHASAEARVLADAELVQQLE